LASNEIDNCCTLLLPVPVVGAKNSVSACRATTVSCRQSFQQRHELAVLFGISECGKIDEVVICEYFQSQGTYLVEVNRCNTRVPVCSLSKWTLSKILTSETKSSFITHISRLSIRTVIIKYQNTTNNTSIV